MTFGRLIEKTPKPLKTPKNHYCLYHNEGNMLFSLWLHWKVMKTLNHIPMSRLVWSTNIFHSNFEKSWFHLASAGCVALWIILESKPFTKKYGVRFVWWWLDCSGEFACYFDFDFFSFFATFHDFSTKGDGCAIMIITLPQPVHSPGSWSFLLNSFILRAFF